VAFIDAIAQSMYTVGFAIGKPWSL